MFTLSRRSKRTTFRKIVLNKISRKSTLEIGTKNQNFLENLKLSSD